MGKQGNGYNEAPNRLIQMTVTCPYFPEEPKEGIKCDYLIGKEAQFKQDYVTRYCKGRFNECTYYWHLEKWKEKIRDVMNEGEDEEAG